MKIAVLLAKDAPTNRKKLPDEWPVSCVEIDDDTTVVDPLLVMSEKELADWRERLMPEYQAWLKKWKDVEKSQKPLWKARNKAKRDWLNEDPEDDELKQVYEAAHAAAEAQEVPITEEPLNLHKQFKIKKVKSHK